MTSGSLSGCGVLVTRPAAQAPTLAEAIEAAGGSALLFPVLVIEPVPLAIDPPPEADWYIFISPNAVKHGWPLVAAQAANARIAAIGPGTAQALTQLGHPADVHPQKGDSENLLAASVLQSMEGQRVVIVRGDGGRELIAETLKQRGAQVGYLEVYRRALSSESTAELNAAWREGRLQAVT
ncbi:MAG TPA: uroporphyrinogen-III synthase, partial [Gammaproteobacteria bacterium]|nr:uroporphyrinogen-III synthase [Gammaproteobacteria bacterium]